MKYWLVIGVYDDDMSSYQASVEADDGFSAMVQAVKDHESTEWCPYEGGFTVCPSLCILMAVDKASGESSYPSETSFEGSYASDFVEHFKVEG